MRKKDETLRRTLLALAKDMAEKNGPESINIRALAKGAGVASGTVYNYFADKDEILLALTEEYWQTTLGEMRLEVAAGPFPQQLSAIYAFLHNKIALSAGSWMGSLGNVLAAGQKRMQQMHQVLRQDLQQLMALDTAIQQDVWNEEFTPHQYADFLIINIIAALRMNAPNIHFLVSIVKKTLY